MSARRVVLAAALFLLAMPGAAHAATASIGGSQVVVNAGAGESNNLYVSDVGPNIRIQDTGSGVTLTRAPVAQRARLAERAVPERRDHP